MSSQKDQGGSVKIECPPSPAPHQCHENQVHVINLPTPLTLEEKKYLLAVERGDLANVRRILQRAFRKKHINVNCVDSFGRGALTLAIENENLEMVELLIVMGVETRDALLIAINSEFVEAVELLLEHEELIRKEGEEYSWQKVDLNISQFTPDVTPLVLAAQKNNYEIIKLLLDRGAALPIPHDIKCGCISCIHQSQEDSLRFSLSRVNEYRALASPSLIALSSTDPLLTAFQLSWELRNLAFTEQESKQDYLELRRQCQQFAVDLLDQTRSSKELAIILNYDPDAPPYMDGDTMKLARLELAIEYKQKKFVAHPNIQQLLASLWYEGVPGFRRLSAIDKVLTCVKVAVLFPVYCMMYMIAPNCETSKLMRKPFMKFLIHASSYLFFLFILILVSLRVEDQLILLLGTEGMKQNLKEQLLRQRGNGPTYLELLLVIYILGFIWEETQESFNEGIKNYLKNMWNFIDFSRNFLYSMVFLLRLIAYIQQRNEIKEDPTRAYITREHWDAFDPHLIAEGLFAAANVFSALKLIHLFSINPHLGPLQISLGRMVIDIVKFFFIYTLVLFAFACGLNQLLWYYADLERKKCYSLVDGSADWDHEGDACMKWRRFANVFEASQSLFWASFGMVDLSSFELLGIKSYTRFWGLLMFGSYSVINVIVLLNLLIAMMSNSYAMIDEHSDTEWKFARTKLWLSYFEDGQTLPPPFNIFPSTKNFMNVCGRKKRKGLARRRSTLVRKEEKERENRYTSVMRALVWRYVAAMHRKEDEQLVTEDDINEVKNDISTMRYEMLEIFKKSGMDVSGATMRNKTVVAKRNKVWERRLMKDFHVAPVEMDQSFDQDEEDAPENETALQRFRRIANRVASETATGRWGEVLSQAGIEPFSQIGRCRNRQSFKNQQNLKKAMVEARRLALKRSPRGSGCISPAEIEIDDPTASTLINLLNQISQEMEEFASPMVSRRESKPLNELGSQLQALISKTPSPLPPKVRAKAENIANVITSPNLEIPKNRRTSVDHKMVAQERILSPDSLKDRSIRSPSPIPRSRSPSPMTSRVTSPVPIISITKDTDQDPPKIPAKKKAPTNPNDISISRPTSIKPVDLGHGMIPPPPAKAEEPSKAIPTVSMTPATPLPKPKAPEPPISVSPGRSTVIVGADQSTSNSQEQLFRASSSPCLRPGKRVEDVKTIKRQPKSGWL